MCENNTMAFMGVGNRGYIYAKLALQTGKIKITAICDTDLNSLKSVGDSLNIPENMRFNSAESFFAAGKLAKVLVISTPDKSHYDNCIGALNTGYDVTLEKPVAVTEKQCRDILETSERTGGKVVVCHVLRYTDFYRKIKEILDAGAIGEIVHFSQSENVGWWHYTQSFVRGKWRNSETSSPMILAKCCHDLDVINWLMGDSCTALTSFGSLKYFTEASAPEGSAANCCDCKVADTCLYSAIKRSKEMPGTMNVPYGFDYSDEAIEGYLSDKGNSYGKCVYRSDNNVVDRQTVAMQYANGATATLNMHAFAQATYRHTKITGTLGEIDALFEEGDCSHIKVSVFGPVDKFKTEDILVNQNETGHGGGDKGFIESIIDYFFFGKQNPDITSLKVSMASHLMAFAAEESRLNGGQPKTF